jgi:hypothetical protein
MQNYSSLICKVQGPQKRGPLIWYKWHCAWNTRSDGMRDVQTKRIFVWHIFIQYLQEIKFKLSVTAARMYNLLIMTCQILPPPYIDNKFNYISVQLPPIFWWPFFCIQNSYDNRNKKFYSAFTGHELKLAPFMFYYSFKTGLPSPFWISLVMKVVPNV